MTTSPIDSNPFGDIPFGIDPFFNNCDNEQSQKEICIVQSLQGKDCKYSKAEYQAFRDRLQIIFDLENTIYATSIAQRRLLMISLHIRLLDAQICIYDDFCNQIAYILPTIESYLPSFEREIATYIPVPS